MRIFGILLVIFIINEKTTSQFVIDLDNIQSIFQWAQEFYLLSNSYVNPDRTGVNIQTILKDVEQISSKLTALNIHLDTKLDSMLESLLDTFEADIDLENPKAMLNKYMHWVDRFHDKSLEYVPYGSHSNETLKQFVDSVLWSPNNLVDILDDIRHLIIPGFLSQLTPGFLSLTLQKELKEKDHKFHCNKLVSAQQRMFYIYSQLIFTEMKGLATLQKTYMTMRFIDKIPNNSAMELRKFRDNFKKRVAEYSRVFFKTMALLPRILRRCQMAFPKRGENFLEVQNFSRHYVINENFPREIPCRWCPDKNKLKDMSSRANLTIHDCKKFDKTVYACNAEPGSSRDYMWWRIENHHFGHKTDCDNEHSISVDNSQQGYFTFYFTSCVVCICSADQNLIENKENSTTIWRISLTEQISDIWNNMIVTGVRFVTFDNGIHIIIQQTQFSHNGVGHNESSWKNVNTQYEKGRAPKIIQMEYQALQYYRKSIDLDDIMLPEKTVITGVRFVKKGDTGFSLQVHGTPFNLATAKLNPSESKWYDAQQNPLNPEDYKRKRIEIELGQPDDPTRGGSFDYDPTSNKFVKFTHTDLDKDAGQTTVPLLDSQSLEAQPPFPLSGIGLYFRGNVDFAGYIALRAYTLDVVPYLDSPNNQISLQSNNQISPQQSCVESYVPRSYPEKRRCSAHKYKSKDC